MLVVPTVEKSFPMVLLICLTDLMATLAEMLNVTLPDNAGEDSVSFLHVLLGQPSGTRRESIVSHSIDGSFAIRQGSWKLALCPGSGGWSPPRSGLGRDALPAMQLFDLAHDISETRNVQHPHPEPVEELLSLLEKYVADGRGTPGTRLANAVEIDLWKSR